VNTFVSLDEASARMYNEAAAVIGHLTQEAAFQGNSITCRCTPGWWLSTNAGNGIWLVSTSARAASLRLSPDPESRSTSGSRGRRPCRATRR
jgi:hypothetical protein